jgi:hypothetical protein
MWCAQFDDRLAAWNSLRSQVQYQPAELALDTINNWWFETPWHAYHLHWDDINEWPDPWTLLSDNIYCDVARGLGILYTITLLDRKDLAPATLVLTDLGHNLVLLDQTKYILNWEKNTIVNTNLEVKVKRQLTQQQIQAQYL